MNYPYYNPYQGNMPQFAPQMPYNQRPAEMGQGYPQPQNVPQTQAGGQTAGFSPASRPVSSREEAMAVGADFSGAPMIFLDVAHNAIYVKRWDVANGNAVFADFAPREPVPQTPPPSPPPYATQEELKALSDRLSKLEKKGAKKNDDE